MDVQKILGDEASYLLDHSSKAIPAELLTTPGPDFVTEIFSQTDRNPQVMRNYQSLLDHGRLAGTRIRVYFACRSGYRTFCSSFFCSES